MRLLLASIFLLGTLQPCWSQFPRFKDYMELAAEAEAKEDYYLAYYYYTQMIEYDRDPELYHYKAALNALNLKAYTTADKHLQHLDTLEVAEEFEDLSYYRAIAAHHRGNYDESITLYNLYISEGEDSLKVEEAKEKIENVEWAMVQKPDTLVKLEHLEEPINSKYSDFGLAPIDDTRFLFSTDRALIDKDNYPNRRRIAHVYYSPDGENAKKLPGDLNKNDKFTSSVAFTEDKSRMYYNVCHYIENSTEVRCDIYSRPFVPDSANYGPEVKLPPPINMSGFSTTQPSIGIDRDGNQLLFFASNRPGGKGEMDLWYAPLSEDGEFGEPVNLDTLNTEKDEWTPFLHELDQDLYFSSEGYLGFGLLDVYKSAWNNGNPDQPINVGAPVNSSFDDVYYLLSESGDNAFFASNREGSYYRDEELEACCFDLYEAHYTQPPVELLVSAYDKYDTTDLLGSLISLIDMTDDIHVGNRTGDSWDDYIFELDHGKDYRLIAEMPGYISDTLDFHTDSLRGVEIIERRLFLDKIVPLEIAVYDENTNEPLPGAIIKLFKVDEAQQDLLASESNPDSHLYNFDLIRGNQYLIFGTKTPLYDTATVDITSTETGLGDSLYKRVDLVQLAIRNLEKVFPLEVYFDNDHPNPGTKKRTTDKRYSETYKDYIARKDEFIDRYTSKLGGTDFAERAKEELNDFFEDEVEEGYEKLNYFMEQLHAVLKGGLLVEVSIKGYTSPIAKGDYNLRLGQRRVECLKNEFLSWNDGALQHFVDIGRLVLKEISFGETKAPEGLSDSALDKRNSVYSPLASKERRVEVIAVRRMANKAKVNQ
ncbi:MAG: hypothetical protein R3275_03395 [Saprospiraceae bacterium]|nr:hypothetical protein [Saprospiraceae bacterium]